MNKETSIMCERILNNIGAQIRELRKLESQISQNDSDSYCRALCAFITGLDALQELTNNKEGK